MSGDRRRRAWTVALVSFVAFALLGLGLGVLAAVRGRLLVSLIFFSFALFEVWRARSVYRRRPTGPPYDEEMERGELVRRARFSGRVVTVCTAAVVVCAVLADDGALWLLASMLAGGTALIWFYALYVLPRAAGTR